MADLEVKEVAVQENVTDRTVRNWINNGTLNAHRIGKRKWLISEDEVARRREESSKSVQQPTTTRKLRPGYLKSLDRLLLQMRVLDPQELPFSLMDDSGFHDEPTAGGGSFRWQGNQSDISLCWVTQHEEQWLLEEVFPRFGAAADGLRLSWVRLQQDMRHYLGEAWVYMFEVETGQGSVTMGTVENAVYTGFGLDQSRDDVKRALFLLSEPRRLRGTLAEFKFQLEAAVPQFPS